MYNKITRDKKAPINCRMIQSKLNFVANSYFVYVHSDMHPE